MRDNQMDILLVGVLLAMPALGIALFGDQGWSLLRFDRAAMLEHGQWWRLLTAHWIHIDHTHLLLNLVALTLILLILGPLLTPLSLIFSALLGALAVSICLLTVSSGLHWYAGLSGVISAIWGTAASRGARFGSGLGWAALLLLLARILWEQLTGANTFVAEFIGSAVSGDANLYGAAAGVLLGLALPRLASGARRVPSNQLP